MKKALLVGINKYRQPGSDLRGCVNDVVNMRKILNQVYKFPLDNIRVLTDDRATQQGITERLNWLIDTASSGDELVFHYSGHGSQVRDRNGDELKDHVDEILCPHNMNWGNPFTDDIIASIFKRLPDEANLTMICDACHSGSMSRSFFEQPEEGEDLSTKDRFLVPPIDIQSRSEGRGNINRSNVGLKQDRVGKPKDQNHILFSGCQDHQTSADAYINGKFQGAMTATLIRAINENPNVDWRHVHKRVNQLLDKAGFSQNPVLSGNNDNIKRKLFGGV